MSSHGNRLSRLARTAATVPPPRAAVGAAEERAKLRLVARLKRELGDDLTDEERAALDDGAQAAADLETYRRNLRAAGVDPDRDTAERRAALLARLEVGDA